MKKFAENPIRSTATETAKRIAGLHIVVDKFHFSGHVDSWCQQNCNPYAYKELDNVSKYYFEKQGLYNGASSAGRYGSM